MCVSSEETEKARLSQRSLSLNIIQSQQNMKPWRAEQHYSDLVTYFCILFEFYNNSKGKVDVREGNVLQLRLL